MYKKAPVVIEQINQRVLIKEGGTRKYRHRLKIMQIKVNLPKGKPYNR